MGWRRSDTLWVLAAFILPTVTGVGSLFFDSGVTVLGVTPILLGWTFWALVGVILASHKVWLLNEDQRALHSLHRGWREWLTGLWTLADALGFLCAFLLWLVVGISAILKTPLLPTGALLIVPAIALGVVVFGLICRHRLTE